jgi:hypothetical protein
MILLLAPILLIAQERCAPIPTGGWDSLRTSIRIPDLFVRAGVRLAVSATFDVDSSGKLLDVTFNPFNTFNTADAGEQACKLTSLDSAFCLSILRACKSVRWTSGSIRGAKTRMAVEVPFIFLTHPYDSRPSDPRLILLDVLRPMVDAIHTH